MANNPYVNKVQLANGTTIIDISDTTAAADYVYTGKYFYDAAGEKKQGSLNFIDIYKGSSAPSSSLGSNGDIYIQS